MRLSYILIPLALLFISSVSAQELLIEGKWSDSYVVNESSKYCCIPTSIEVPSCSAGSNSCYIYYKYSSSDSKCWNLFSKNDGYTAMFVEDNEPGHYGVGLAGLSWHFVFSGSLGYPRLNIYSIPPNDDPNRNCDFAMNTRKAFLSTFEIGFIVAILILIIFVIILVGAKKYQSKQANAIIAKNFTQGPQLTYAAPNQLPNTQVNFGGNARYPNTQVNMSFDGTKF